MSEAEIIGIDIYSMNIQVPLHVAFEQHKNYKIHRLNCDVVEFVSQKYGFVRYSISSTDDGATAKLKQIDFHGACSCLAIMDFWNMIKGKGHEYQIDSRVLWSDGHIDKMYLKNNDSEYETIDSKVFPYLMDKLANKKTVMEGKRDGYLTMLKKYFGIGGMLQWDILNHLRSISYTGKETEGDMLIAIQQKVNSSVYVNRWNRI